MDDKKAQSVLEELPANRPTLTLKLCGVWGNINAFASGAEPTRVPQPSSRNAILRYVSERLGLLAVSRYVHRYNFHWYSLSWCPLLWSAASPGSGHLQRKRKRKQQLTKAILWAVRSSRTQGHYIEITRIHATLTINKGLKTTISTLLILLLRWGRIYNSLHFTVNPINLFFDQSQMCSVGRGLKLPHKSLLNHNRIMSCIGSLATSLNHIQALRFWRLPMTSTLTNDCYKPQPSLLGGADVVLTSQSVSFLSLSSVPEGMEAGWGLG